MAKLGHLIHRFKNQPPTPRHLRNLDNETVNVSSGSQHHSSNLHHHAPSTSIDHAPSHPQTLNVPSTTWQSIQCATEDEILELQKISDEFQLPGTSKSPTTTRPDNHQTTSPHDGREALAPVEAQDCELHDLMQLSNSIIK